MSDPWELTVEGGPIDDQEVRRALGLLVDPAHWVMVQGLPSGAYRHLPGHDLDAIVRAVADLSGGFGTYFTLNPYRGPLDHCLRSADVLSRRWFMIDPDARKEQKGLSTTEAEKEASRAVTEAIRDYLKAEGWPDPVYLDSGNNWQLLYRVDLPNDKLAQQYLKHCLIALGDRFDTPAVGLDRSVHDAKRIGKIPGTWVRKGANTPERPHRLSRLMSVPMTLSPVPIARIKALAGLAGTTPPQAAPPAPLPAQPWQMIAGSGDKQAYARAALERECGKVATCTDFRNDTLYDAALKLGTLVAAGLLDEAEVKKALDAAGHACGLGSDGDPNEIHRAIANGFAFGLQHPREVPERIAPPRNGVPHHPKPAPSGIIIVRASEITPRKVEWLWPGRIPLGKLTTFAGVGGLGKTFVLCDITARVSVGNCWPDSEGECATPGQVLFVSGEDDADDTLVPRLIELGADLERVIFLKTEVQDRFTLEDLPTLDTALDQAGPGVSFVAIDPPTAYLGGIDDHKNSELRALLSPLKSWASRRRVALVFNTHVTKPQGAKVEAMMRVMGSVAWVNAVRAAHMFAKDPSDPTRRLFVGMKLNIGEERKGLAYRIVKTETLARIEWLGVVDVTADEAVNHDVKKPKRLAAEDWFKMIFRQKREWTNDEFWQSCNVHGITQYGRETAQAKLGIPRPRRLVNENGDPIYIWFVPPDWPYLDPNT